jgi:hypothetical protein
MSIRLPLAAGGFCVGHEPGNEAAIRIYDLSRISLIFAASKVWVMGF